MRTKLTQKIVAALDLPPGKSEEFTWDEDFGGGFGVRLRRGRHGKISRGWVYQYDHGPQTRRISLGAAAVVSYAAARQNAAKLQARVRLGEDPAAERHRARARAGETVAAALRTYLPQKRTTMRQLSYIEIERHLLKDLKALHALQLADVTTRDIATCLMPLTDAVAINARRSLNTFFMWALRQALVAANPVIGVEQRKQRAREHVIDADGLKAIWHATETADDFSVIVRLLMLTAARRSEIGGLRWSEVYDGRVILPAERTKGGHSHTIPITPPMRALLDARPRRPGRDLIFGRDDGRPFGNWGWAKIALDARIKAASFEMKAWRLHDLRRSAATGMGELGIEPHVIEAALGHVSEFRTPISRVYNLSRYEAPIRAALTAWAAHLDEIITGRVVGDRVVPLPLRA